MKVTLVVQSPKSRVFRLLRLGPMCLLALGCWTACAGTATQPVSIAIATRELDTKHLLSLVPAESELVWTVDMTALRNSPWTQEAVTQALVSDQGNSLFDQKFAREVEQVVFAVLPSLGEGTSLIIANGSFQRNTLLGLFQDVSSEEKSSFYRGIEIVERGSQALALQGNRLVLSGPTVAVRSAIDCGFAKARDIRSEPWVEDLSVGLRSIDGAAVDPESVVAYVRLSDSARRQLLSELGDGDTLEAAGLRLVLGADMHVAMMGVTRTDQEAVDFSARLGQQLQVARTRPLVALLGLSPVLSKVKFRVSQNRVFANLVVSASEQKEISRRMTMLSQMLTRLHKKKSQEKTNP